MGLESKTHLNGSILPYFFCIWRVIVWFQTMKTGISSHQQKHPLIIPHPHLSWASFEHLYLWILCCDLQSVKVQFSRIKFSVWHFLSTLLMLDMESYNTLRNSGSTITWHLRSDFPDLTVDKWGTSQTGLLCSSVKSIVVLHNSTAVLME